MSKQGLGLVLIGAPGSGKGTQAEYLIKEYGFAHLSTGDMLRAEISSGSVVGQQAKALITEGKLVPDDMVIAILKEALRKLPRSQGFILDGFPRNVAQGQKLDQLVQELDLIISLAIEIAVDDAQLIRRITGRRIHQASGRSYHIEFNPPKVADIDDVTGEPLIHRSDDTESVLKVRLETYYNNTKPVLDHYKTQGKLVSVDGNQKSNQVWEQIRTVLEKKQ